MIQPSQRPSPAVLARALYHLTHGVMAYAERQGDTLILPSGRGGSPHVVAVDGTSCTCRAGREGQVCWAACVAALLSGASAQWGPEEAPDYGPAGAPPVEPEPATEPQPDTAHAEVADLLDRELALVTDKVAMIAGTGYGILTRFWEPMARDLGVEAARHAHAEAAVRSAHRGSCALCGGDLANFGSRSAVCWNDGLIVPRPASANAA